MATITKKVSKNIEPNKRYQYWSSAADTNDEGGSFATDDVFMIETSLGKPAHYLWIETTTGTTLTIRINSQVVRYPMRDPRLNDNPMPRALDEEFITTDSTMAAVPMGANEVWTMEDVIPITDIQIASLSGGSFELLVA